MAHHLECCTQPWRKILLLASHFLLHSQHLYLHFLKLKDEDTVKKNGRHIYADTSKTLWPRVFSCHSSVIFLWLSVIIWYQIGSFPKADVKTWSVVFFTDLNFFDFGFLQGWTPCWDGQLCLRPIYAMLLLNTQTYSLLTDNSTKWTPL